MYVTLLLLLCIGLVPQAPPTVITVSTQKYASNKSTNPQRQPNEKSEAKAVTVTNSFDQQQHANSKEGQGECCQETRLYHAYLWATIVGVVGSWFLILVVLRQVKIAKESAEAVVTIESGWVAFKMESIGEDVFLLSFTNAGKTPIFITIFNSDVVFPESLEALENYPIKKQRLNREKYLAPKEMANAYLARLSEARQELERKKLWAICGFIEYRTIFKKTDSFYFGYFYDPDSRQFKSIALGNKGKNTK
jgi:hypothetical protein